jgi:acetyltransferase-like isoleucine patch superfamily enzyme
MIIGIIKYGFRLFRKATDNLTNYMCLKINRISYGNNLRINGRIYISNKGKVTIGNNFRANSGKNYNPIGGDIILRFVVKKDAKLTIGNNVGISNSVMFISQSITIEDNVLIGGNCKIYDSDFHSINYEDRMSPYLNGAPDFNVNNKPVVIKEGAWLGGHCIVLKGVCIGKKAIVGAGSVVTKNIPDHEMWAGNPARYIRKLL